MKADRALLLNRAYQIAFEFGGSSPNPSLKELSEFEKLIDINDAHSTGRKVWNWKRENYPFWREHMILCESFIEFGNRIINAIKQS